jgi:hypothetical protein
MIVPGTDFLREVEKLFAVSYPRPFREFCERYARQNILEAYPAITLGKFITGLESLKTVNARIGFEQRSGLERAIAGEIYPKDGMKLLGEILPIYFDADDIYGYYCPEPENYKVYVWSVHCIVHAFPDLESWLAGFAR